MNRRDFIAAATSTILPLTVNGLNFKTFSKHSPIVQSLMSTAANNADKVLVMIYLNGGNDGLNTVIPLDSYSRYYKLRTNIAIPESQVLKLSGFPETGFHPVMTGMRDLFNEGKLGIIHSVSYPNPNFSHYRSSDIWMTGVDSNQFADTGWAGRYLDNRFPGFPASYPNQSMKDPLALQIGAVSSTTLLGPHQPMNVTIQDPESFYKLVGQMEQLPSTDLPCCEAGRRIDFIRKQQILSVGYSAEIKTAADAGRNLATYPAAGTNSLAEQLKIIARLIHGGLQSKIYFAELRGFDTHALQVSSTNTTEGEHARLLRLLSEAITAFQADLKLQGTQDKVIGMTFSDFGRRVDSNASFGTDHGSSSPMFVFGTGLKRQMVGTNPNLTTDLDPMFINSADTNVNVKMQVDFRRVYSDILRDWFGTPATTTNSLMYRNFPTTSLFSNLVFSTASGAWQNRGTWSSGRTPGPKDHVIISAGHVITANQNLAVKNIQVESGGELLFTGNYTVTTSG
ncbi:MAG: DUF1501 domain-containing protein [Dyadobacter fermentans]